jgi:hypothetical protein
MRGVLPRSKGALRGQALFTVPWRVSTRRSCGSSWPGRTEPSSAGLSLRARLRNYFFAGRRVVFLNEFRKKAQRQVTKRMSVSQAQLARLEQPGSDAYTLNSLRRYVAAVGDGLGLKVRVGQREPKSRAARG